jgi:tetratricopeptide (TPR) repeat protein
MKCDRVQSVMDAFCDGELNRWTVLRVGRHLKGCPDCESVRAETARIGAEAREWRDVSASPEWHRRAAAQLLTSPEASASLASDLSPMMSLRRLRERTLMKRLSMAGVVMAAAGGLVVISLRPSPAYARLKRVSNAFTRLQSAHFVGWRRGPGDAKVPVEVWFAEPNSSWQKEGDRLEICDGEHVWRYREGAKAARRLPFTPQDRAAAWRHLFTMDAQLQWVKANPDRLTDLGTQSVDGETLRALRLNGPDLDERTTWWVDPDTSLIRRFVQEQATGPSGKEWRVKTASERIEYDVTPPDRIFAFAPPPGTRVFDLPPGHPGSFLNRLGIGRPLAALPNRARDYYNPDGEGKIELLAFTHSQSGLIFAAVRGDEGSGSPVSDGRLTLIDADGHKTVGRGFDSAGTPTTGNTYLFIPRSSEAGSDTTEYRLVYTRSASGKDDQPETVAAFEGLRLTPPPPLLDELAEDFAREEMHTSLERLRDTDLGLAAFREGGLKEAEARLSRVASQTGFGYGDRRNEVFLSLADLYIQTRRFGSARRALDRLYTLVGGGHYDQGVIMDGADRLATMGDVKTAVRWLERILKAGPDEYPAVPGEMVRAAKAYVALGGRREVAVAGMERSMRGSHAPGHDSLGSGDATGLAVEFEALGRKDLALEAYTKGLETSGMLKYYREHPGEDWAFHKDVEAMIGKVRRLGGEEAVRRLRDRSG